MPFVPVPNCVEAEIRMTWDLQEVENTLYFDFGDTPTVGGMVTLMNDLFDWWTTNMAPLIFGGVQLREIVVTDISSATGPQVSFTPPIAEFGSASGASLPNNVSFTVSFRTASRGRSFRGRNYVVGLTEGAVVGNTVDTAVVNAYIAAYAELKNSPILDDGVWSVVSRFSGVNPTTGKPIPRTTGIATPITSVIVVDSTIDSQRRRLPGRGK